MTEAHETQMDTWSVHQAHAAAGWFTSATVARLRGLPRDSGMQKDRILFYATFWLSGPENDTPRIYHKSFPEFTTDARRCSNVPRFHVPIEFQHGRIARDCFRVMDEQLRANICDLKFPERYLDNEKIHHLAVGRISSELQYASLYWATHLCSAEKDDDLFALFEKFSFTHLLHWLEVLSLIGRLEVAYTVLDNSKRFAVGGFTQSSEPSV